MKNKTLLIPVIVLLALMLVVLPLLAACGSPAPTTAPAPAPKPAAPAPAPAPTTGPAPAPAPAPTVAAPAGKPITFRVAMQNPPMAANSQAMARWAEAIAKQSGGRLIMQVYYGESLAKASEVYRATQTGVCDIGYTTIGNDASLTPLSNITRLPFLGMPSPKGAGNIFWDLYNKFPDIQKEWQGMKPLAINGLPPDQFHFTKKEVKLPGDIKGMKIIARGEWPEVIRNMGAAPVDLMVGDWYTGLERGLVEGQVVHFLAADTFKLLPLYNYNLILGDGGASMTSEIYMVNISSFNSLPSDLQKLLMEASQVLADDALATNDRMQAEAIQKTKDLKKSFYYATDIEIKLWQDAGKSRITSWLSENNAKGLPATAVYAEMQALIKKYATVK